MHRRDFTRGVVVALIGIPAARLLSACSSSASTARVIDLGPSVAGGPGPDAAIATPNDLGTSDVDLAQTSSDDLAMLESSDLAPSTITYTSTIDSAHTHQITLEVSLYANPPSVGILRMTTVDLGHSHTVTLTHAQLVAIANGTVLTVPTGVTSGHSHCFHFTDQG